MPAAINRDYRNTDGCPVLTDVKLKKRGLEDRIRRDHKRAKIMYDYVHNKGDEYFIPFSQIYNCKCAYCGISIGIINVNMFEVDHFICESKFSDDPSGRSEAGKVHNLVLSCYYCNRKKGGLVIADECTRVLNPDDGSIANVFFRDEDYYIRIQPDYAADDAVSAFYEKLQLGNEFRRLDYLLLEMKNLIYVQDLLDPGLKEKLEQCFARLMLKRNKTIVEQMD